jgi:hypothetical protein
MNLSENSVHDSKVMDIRDSCDALYLQKLARNVKGYAYELCVAVAAGRT